LLRIQNVQCHQDFNAPIFKQHICNQLVKRVIAAPALRDRRTSGAMRGLAACPQSKSLAAEPLSIFRQAVTVHGHKRARFAGWLSKIFLLEFAFMASLQQAVQLFVFRFMRGDAKRRSSKRRCQHRAKEPRPRPPMHESDWNGRPLRARRSRKMSKPSGSLSPKCQNSIARQLLQQGQGGRSGITGADQQFTEFSLANS